MVAPRCVWDAGATLGEGPVWIPEERALYWVDIKAPAVHRFDPSTGGRRSWPMPRTLGCLVPSAGGGFVAGFHDGFARVDLDRGKVDPIVDPEPDRPANRLNDAKCDGQGRLWAGSMDDAERQRTGALYRILPDGSCTRMDDGYFITNGPAFSTDGSVMYHTDSVDRTIFAFDLAADGALSGKRTFVRFPDDAGHPDGMTVDTEGHLWVAHFGGARVSRFDPEGALVSEITLPVANVTSCAFGGADLRTLYVTTAAKGLSPAQRAAQPLAGGLFEVRVGVAGLPVARFGG
jgi:sugar lactone lactonase YvrE